MLSIKWYAYDVAIHHDCSILVHMHVHRYKKNFVHTCILQKLIIQKLSFRKIVTTKITQIMVNQFHTSKNKYLWNVNDWVLVSQEECKPLQMEYTCDNSSMLTLFSYTVLHTNNDLICGYITSIHDKRIVMSRIT